MANNTPTVSLQALLEHRPWVRGLARSLVIDDSTADDVEQKTWLAALSNPPRDPAAVRGWLARVVRNAAAETGRTEGRRRKHETDAIAERPGSAPPVDNVVADAEQHKRVVVALTELEEPYRTTLLLRFYEGLPPREVAQRMDVPAETVRTRTRRGLDRMRAHFDSEHGGDRRAWKAALLPFIAAPGNNDGTGRHPMKTTALLTLAALTLVVGALTIALTDDRGNAGEPPTETAEETDAAQTDGEPNPHRRRFDTPPPPPPVIDGGDEEESSGSRVVPFDPTTGMTVDADLIAKLAKVLELPESMKGVSGTGVLVLRTRMEPETPRSGDPVKLIAEFENVGDAPTRLFVEQFAGSMPFPDWSLRHRDGRTFKPVLPPFQSMWSYGVQGAIVIVAPGARHTVVHESHGFREIRLDDSGKELPDAQWDKGAALPAGSYVVAAAHEQTTTSVPFSAESFGVESRVAHGLWTGAARADERSILVERSIRPTLVTELPETLRPGTPIVAQVTLTSPAEAREFPSALTVVVHAKAHGAWSSVPVAIDDPTREVKADGPDRVALAADGTRTFEVDLTRLSFRYGDGEDRPTAGFFEVAPPGSVAVSLSLGHGDTALRAASATHAVKFDAKTLPPHLILRAVIDGPGANGAPLVRVELLNTGDAAVRVPARFAVPSDLWFSLRPKDPKRAARHTEKLDASPPPLPLAVTPDHAVVPEGTHFLPRNYDRPGALVATDFVDIAPKKGVEHLLEIGKYIGGRLPAGEYRLFIRWRSVETGLRLGLDAPAAVGTLDAALLDFTATGD